MKNKKISKRIKRSYDVIKEFNNKEKSSITDETSNFFEKLLKKHDHAINLRDEIASLKTKLIAKKKEIGQTIKDLTQSQKLAKKALKESRKSNSINTAYQAIKSRTSRSVAQVKVKQEGTPEKSPKSAKKSPKTASKTE